MATTLRHSPAKIVRQLLLDQALASASGDWQCFYGREPTAPDNCLSVFESQGVDAGFEMVAGQGLGHEGFQVRVRGKDQDTARTRADAIASEFNAMMQAQYVTVGGQQYAVWPIAADSPLHNGVEPGTNRDVYTINCVAAMDEWPLS